MAAWSLPENGVTMRLIFRGSAEQPIYRIEKTRGDGRQPGYSVVGMDGRILQRGGDLREVLRVLDRKLIRIVD
jgi:hypothetical protein